MKAIEALEIMGFSSVEEITQDELRKTYRKLMKKYHPDLCNNDDTKRKFNEDKSKKINEANELLVSMLNQISALKKLEKATQKKEVMAIIPFDALIDIYNNKEIKLRSGEEQFCLNRYNVKAHRIILCIDIEIQHNTLRRSYSFLKPVLFNDDYEVDCEIDVTENIPEDIVVYAYGKVIKLTLDNISTKLRLRFENSINLSVNIRKKFIQNN